MNIFRIVGIILIIAGVLGLIYGKFSYTKETKETKMGPIEVSIKEQQMVNVPFWIGASSVVFGGLILLFGVRRD